MTDVTRPGKDEVFTTHFRDRYGLALDVSGVTFAITGADGALDYIAPQNRIRQTGPGDYSTRYTIGLAPGSYDATWIGTATYPDSSSETVTGLASFEVQSLAIPVGGTWSTTEQARIDARTDAITDEALGEGAAWVEVQARYSFDELERLSWLDAAHTRKNLRGLHDVKMLRLATAEMAAYFAGATGDEEADDFIVSMARYRAAGFASVSQPGGLSVSFSNAASAAGGGSVDRENSRVKAALAYISRTSRQSNRPVITSSWKLQPEPVAIPYGYHLNAQPGDAYPIRRRWR